GRERRHDLLPDSVRAGSRNRHASHRLAGNAGNRGFSGDCHGGGAGLEAAPFILGNFRGQVMTSQNSASAAHVAGGEDTHPHSHFWKLTVGCIGVVYGDIGTSPLYAVREAIT